MSLVKTSIIIPIYNTEKYIDECLQSVFSQTQKEYEIIAVDDGSEDNSLGILRQYEKECVNLRVYTQENQRQGAARNKGIVYARGEYIYFLDSDDTIDRETLEECYTCAVKNDLDVVLFDSKVIIEEGIPENFCPDSFDRRDVIQDVGRVYSGKEFLKCYMEKNPDTVSPCMMYISRKFLYENSLGFMEQVLYEDEEFRFNLMQRAKRIMYIPKLYYNRRYRSDSTMTVDYDFHRNSDLVKVLEQMIEDVEDEQSFVLKRYLEKKMWMLLDRCNIMEESQKDNWKLVCMVTELLHKYCDKFNMPKDIEDIKFRVYYVDYMQRIFRTIDCTEEKKLADKQRMVLLGNLPLGETELCVGLYGRKDYIDRLLWRYKKEIGKIGSKIYIMKKDNDIDKANDEISLPFDEVERLDIIYFLSGEEQEKIIRDFQKRKLDTVLICLGDSDGNFLF